ncbi:transcription factor [Ganoderma sinense ZZ0214-1]|uniref:Transcription factor n=1 Tax=Ganoderma sinense ZZ0214-1 TaxID=1077348 RepID=A0A2G8RNV0_9APHY|nr:transcription factor [Ganoderma sinense ZZ0214-1]
MAAAPSVDPSASFAFAPNVTPGTFNDPPSPTDSSSDLLFPATEGGSAPRRAAHAKKKPENHIPRPPNAFILFRSSFIKNQHVSSEVETNHSTLSKIIGLTWQNLPHEERQVWHAKAKAALEEHKRKFPQYAFRPLHTKGKAPAEKRKVREVEPKDMKRCEKIAQLLIEGMKGAALDAAIQEFDKHHVPEVVTRFEAPITARHYRRSSSAPAPDSEHTPFLKQEEQTPSPSSSKPKPLKVRSSSSQPDATRSSPMYECPTPSPPSEADTESDYYSSPAPSSPYPQPPSSPYPQTPTYALAPQQPSFDFSTFTFNSADAAPAMSYQPCDPLDQQSAYEMYAPQDSQESFVSFDQPCLTINTSFGGSWPGTTSSSPLSSIPGTPQMYSAVHPPCDPTAVIDTCFHSLSEVYDPSADYLPQPQDPAHHHQLYSAGVPVSVPVPVPASAYCALHGHPHGMDCSGMDMAYGAAHAQDFGGVPPKDGFSPFYGRQALDAAVYAPASYMAPVPAFM